MISLPVKNVDIEVLQEIFAKFTQIELAVLFGSRARGDANSFSDYDFAIVHRGDIWDFSRLWVELAHAMDIDDRDIDLVDLLRAGKNIKKEIANTHILIKGSEDELARVLGSNQKENL